ncbi:phage terminase large subunit family protein [Rhodopirellula sp. P2]|uniref:phage terminase large subunit family protein n=1 Tax=Rhodopirellula sp. P2 TaxID=2127060 RepID=UPI00236782BC|nr:phage terminase large subunit family protein [Rhodopirellula sp. P2]WDQ15241.1 hypothetical protein PSR62_16525 [Rhodopirellula sp. P2]
MAESILPAAWFVRVRDSSKKWMIRCPHCHREQSVWDVGGIRCGAASVGKRIQAHCEHCGNVTASMHYQDDN